MSKSESRQNDTLDRRCGVGDSAHLKVPPAPPKAQPSQSNPPAAQPAQSLPKGTSGGQQ